MPQRMFISHSHDDSVFCARLSNYIQQCIPESDVFYSSRDIGINNFQKEIGRQIASREVFIVVISPKSVVSPWVGLECEQALRAWVKDQERPEPQRQGRVIIPVLHKRDADLIGLSPAASRRDFNPCGEAVGGVRHASCVHCRVLPVVREECGQDILHRTKHLLLRGSVECRSHG